MPTFVAGEQRTARVPIINNTDAQQNCYIMLVLEGTATYAVFDSVPVVPGQLNLDFLLTMPMTPGTYPVITSIYTAYVEGEGAILLAERRDEEVVII